MSGCISRASAAAHFSKSCGRSPKNWWTSRMMARSSAPEEHNVPPITSVAEYENRRNGAPAGLALVRSSENAAKEFVAVAGRRMEGAAGLLIVSVIRERAGFPIKLIGPICVGHRGSQD